MSDGENERYICLLKGILSSLKIPVGFLLSDFVMSEKGIIFLKVRLQFSHIFSNL